MKKEITMYESLNGKVFKTPEQAKEYDFGIEVADITAYSYSIIDKNIIVESAIRCYPERVIELCKMVIDGRIKRWNESNGNNYTLWRDGKRPIGIPFAWEKHNKIEHKYPWSEQ